MKEFHQSIILTLCSLERGLTPKAGQVMILI